MNMINIVDS